MLSKTSAFESNYYGETKSMSFLIKDDDFLNKYNIWNKVSDDIKKETSSNVATCIHSRQIPKAAIIHKIFETNSSFHVK